MSSKEDIDTFGPFIVEHDAQVAAKERERVLNEVVRLFDVEEGSVVWGWIEKLRQREQPR